MWAPYYSLLTLFTFHHSIAGILGQLDILATYLLLP